MASIKLTPEQKDEIIEKYKQYQLPNDGKSKYADYVIFKAETPEYIFSIYSKTKKLSFTLVLDLGNIHTFANLNNLDISSIKGNSKTHASKEMKFTKSEIGSDEVGFGDFYGPFVVCAVFVDKKGYELVKKYNIDDSKKLSDTKIKEVVPLLLQSKLFDYSILVEEPEKIQELYEKNINTTQQKSILHNQVLNNLYKKHKNVTSFYIDQFVGENTFNKHIFGFENNISNITFEIKAESAHPSVAVASCIARYHFLSLMEKLNKKYNLEIPLGAGLEVDEFTKKFVKLYGINELKKICKQHFRNFKDLLNNC